jgi:molecular chaperone DnaJ
MAADYKDYYKILGIDKSADEATIKSAYRKLARKHHPDVNQNDKTSEEKFKDVSEAYEVLSDADKRTKYDQYGDQWKAFSQNGAPAGYRPGYSSGGTYVNPEGPGFGGLDDLFATLFGGADGGGGFGGFANAGRQQQPQRGQDIDYRVEISFAEAYNGTTRSFTATLPETCPRCHGHGRVAPVKGKNCPTCHGTGKAKGTRSLFGNAPCPDCEGTGQAMEICPECHGQGSIETQRRLNDVRIPAGIKEGQKLRLAGQGPKGADLYLKISIRADARFERHDDDIHTDFEIPYTVAALGGEAKIETPEGPKPLDIPAGTQTGQAFRLTGKGMPKLKGGGKGNLIARAKITVPKNLSPRERDLLKEIASLRQDGVTVGT